MRFRTNPWWLLGAAVGMVGCVELPIGSDGGSSGDMNEATSSSTTGGVSASETSVGSTSASTLEIGSTSSDGVDDSTSDDGWPCGAPGGEGRIAHCSPDAGTVSFECDLLAQDCPEGERCMPWANDGGATWNATRCSPIAREADPLGATCTVEGSAVSGIDSCELGAQCWNVDPVTLEGVCVPMCTGALDDLSCEDPGSACLAANDGAIVLCLRTCDPLLQECEGSGEVCVPESTGGSFACVPVSGEPAADGEACEYLNVCAPGSTCAEAEAVPGCEASLGCCTPFCDLIEPACPLPGTECVPWYTEGQSPGIESLGVCAAVPGPAEDWSRPDVVRADVE